MEQTLYFNSDLINRMQEMYAELINQTGDLNLQVTLESYMYVWLYRIYGNNPQDVIDKFPYMEELYDFMVKYFEHFETMNQEELAELAISILEDV